MSHAAIVITVAWLQKCIKYVKPFWLIMQIYDELYSAKNILLYNRPLQQGM